jgi:hypothetical protein
MISLLSCSSCRFLRPSLSRLLSAAATPVIRPLQDEHLPQRPQSIHEVKESQTVLAWVDLLHVRERLHGLNGVEATFWDLIHSKWDLPVHHWSANLLWQKFLEHPALREHVIAYALDLRARTGRVYPDLYTDMMTLLLRDLNHKTQDAVDLHYSFISWRYTINWKALQRLARLAASSNGGISTFAQLYDHYLNPSELGLYEPIIHTLCDRGEWRLAVQWHDKLVANGDMPVDSHNPITYLKRARPDLPLVRKLNPASSPAAGTYRAKSLPSGNGFLKSATGVLNLKLPSVTANTDPLSDHLCARLFATRSFSVNFIISGLKLFESRVIGPLAMRELFLRAETPTQAKGFINTLREADISIAPSAYSRVVKTFAVEGPFDVLRSLVESDLHPDTLDDPPLQRQLLKMYHDQGDRLGEQRTLAILKLISDDSQEMSARPLRYAERRRMVRVGNSTLVNAGQLNRLSVFLEDRVGKGVLFEDEFAVLWRGVIRPRVRGKRPDKTRRFDNDLATMTNICLIALQKGHHVPANMLREILKRWGMIGKFDQVIRLCNFLVRNFGQQPETRGRRLDRSLFSKKGASRLSNVSARPNAVDYVQEVLGANGVEGIIVWGLKIGLKFAEDVRAGITSKRMGPSFLFLGLKMVQLLAKHGLVVETSEVARILQQRLFIIMGLGRAARRRHNILAQELNPYSLEELVFAAERIWTGPSLFPRLWNPTFVSGSIGRYSPMYVRKVLVPPLLQGLLDFTSAPNKPMLKYEERIAQRVQLRDVILGQLKSKERTRMDRKEFARLLLQHAINTDEMLIRRRRFGATTWGAYQLHRQRNKDAVP